MPEVIEVKGYTDFIKKHILKKRLRDLEIVKGRYKTHGAFEFYTKFKNHFPLKVLDVNSKGKYMYITFENDFYLGVTLGLMGGWFYKKSGSSRMIHGLDTDRFDDQDRVASYINNAKNNINVILGFNDGTLYFYDQLSFGTMKIFTSKYDLDKKLSTIGIDMMDLETTFEMFYQKIDRHNNENKYIGNVLMNQKLISGIGNYLRSDILYMSKISPFRKVKNLTTNELITIFNNSRKLIWSSYDYEEALRLKIIKNSDILPVNYDRDFLVYMHHEDIYGNPVIKEKLYEGSQIRFIYWVKKIQK